jgi:beta-mannosidase
VKNQTLSGRWQFRMAETDEWMPATVPGGVHTDLLDIGLISDPFVSDHEKDVMWVAEKDWVYSYTFKPDAEILDEEKVFLVCDGLDTLAKVSLNGKVLGETHNQFRQYRWNVKDILSNSENRLEIYFSGPSTYVAAEQNQRRLKGVTAAIDGGPHLRKAPCQFGWDWGPMLPSIGIWKDIRLEGRRTARLSDVHIRQFHNQDTVLLQVQTHTEYWTNGNLSVELKINSPDGLIFKDTAEISGGVGTLESQIKDPLLWWTNGLGEQNLYDVTVILRDEQNILDKRDYKVGLRTLELVQENDEFGKSFQFVVNGIPIFAKGSNWIPADSFLTRFSDERLEKLIADAAASHQNMLRVWGGGLYEEERFYDLCDKYGILVWQDFIFSCSIYPLDKSDFHENVRIEVEENIKRLRHRASLALWCGNNEMEWGWESWGWAKHPMEDQLPALVEQFPALGFLLEAIGERDLLPDWEILKDAYDKFFHHTLPSWIGEFDPDTPYWPSSPSSDTPFLDVNGQVQGDAHYWEVWHGRKPFTEYRKTFPRFMSEFGFQALPNMETVEFYTTPHDRNLTSYIMEHHQRGNHGNGLIIAQMTETFRMPKDFTAWIYLSLVLQSEGIRYGVEHWRRNMHRVAGTLYWQLNDCWPVASWASIDYFGRWKALHYLARRFYAPILLSIEDKPPVMDVHVANDLAKTWKGTIKWSLESITGDVIDNGVLQVNAEPLVNTLIHNFNFSDRVTPENERDLVFICELWREDEHISTSVGTFVPNKHISFVNPELKVEIDLDGDELILELQANSIARFVELKLTGTDVVFSDNYFDVPAGRVVTVTCPIPDGWTLEKTKEKFRVYSLYDSFV